MQQREVGQNTIEAGIGERKILRVALLKWDPRKHVLRDGDHLPGKIETGWESAALRRGRGDVSRAAADIQDRHVSGNFDSLEQGRNELARGGRPDGIVFAGDAFPAFMLELGEIHGEG